MVEREGLGKYVRRILREKEITPSEVERRAAGSISDSYVASITTGTITNLTINKLKALARGLGVPEAQILTAACDIALPDSRDFYESEFAVLYDKYRQLSDNDQKEMQAVLEMVDREIERRIHSGCERD